MCTCHVYCVWVSQEKSWESGNPKMESEIFGSSNLRASHPVPVGISPGACRYLTQCLSVSDLVPAGISPVHVEHMQPCCPGQAPRSDPFGRSDLFLMACIF